MATLPAIAAVAAVLASLAVPAAVPATRPEPVVAGIALDAALDGERALLSFLPPEVTGGRFRFAREADQFTATPAPRGGGVFWRTPAGNVYTRAEPYDAAAVARHVAPVAARSRALREAYRGAEFQFTLEDLLARSAAPMFTLLGLARDVRGCVAAAAAYDAAFRSAVRGLEPDFRPAGRVERWTLPTDELWEATAHEGTAATRVCRSSTHDYLAERPRTPFVVERSARGVAVRGGEPFLRSEVELVVTPGTVGPPPTDPDPADGFGPVGDYLLRVDGCGGLPWEYNNFAAANSYTRPESRYYGGPEPLVTAWACGRDVREEYRDDAS